MIMSVTTRERIHQNNVDRTEVILNVENLSKVYVSSMGKVVSLRNVSFKVNKGEFVSVVGATYSYSTTGRPVTASKTFVVSAFWK